jgi:hypothetical protein
MYWSIDTFNPTDFGKLLKVLEAFWWEKLSQVCPAVKNASNNCINCALAVWHPQTTAIVRLPLPHQKLLIVPTAPTTAHTGERCGQTPASRSDSRGMPHVAASCPDFVVHILLLINQACPDFALPKTSQKLSRAIMQDLSQCSIQ